MAAPPHRGRFRIRCGVASIEERRSRTEQDRTGHRERNSRPAGGVRGPWRISQFGACGSLLPRRARGGALPVSPPGPRGAAAAAHLGVHLGHVADGVVQLVREALVDVLLALRGVLTVSPLRAGPRGAAADFLSLFRTFIAATITRWCAVIACRYSVSSLNGEVGSEKCLQRWQSPYSDMRVISLEQWSSFVFTHRTSWLNCSGSPPPLFFSLTCFIALRIVVAARAGGAAMEDSGQPPRRASSARRTAGTASSSTLSPGPRRAAPAWTAAAPPRGGGGGGKEGGGGQGGSPSCWHSATIAGSSKMPHGTMQCPPRPIPARPGARCAPPPSPTFLLHRWQRVSGAGSPSAGRAGSARRCCWVSPARAPARRTATGLRHHRGQGRGESAAQVAGYHRGRFAVGVAGRGLRRARGGHRPAGGGGGGGGAIMRKKGEKKNGFSPAGSPMMAHAGRLALEVLQQQSLQLFRRAGGAGELEGYSRQEEERTEETSASTATPRTAPTRGTRVRDSAESFHLGVGLLRARQGSRGSASRSPPTGSRRGRRSSSWGPWTERGDSVRRVAVTFPFFFFAVESIPHEAPPARAGRSSG